MKIVIAGTTGVGKSTTVKTLEKFFKKKGKSLQLSSELVIESPFFDLYFKNLEEWGFLSQLDFLLERFWQYAKDEIDNSKLKDDRKIYLYDRHFIEDKVFSELKSVTDAIPIFKSKIYKDVYNQILEKMDANFGKIDFMILLKADFEVIIKRMEKRGRLIEKKFSREYWRNLYDGYYSNEENLYLFKKYSKNFTIIDTTNLNPDQVLKIIVEKMDNLDLIKK